jgi:hypothetical protein
MNKSLITLIVCLILQSGTLESFSQTVPEPPVLSDPASYTWILLPDVQSYQKFGRNQALFHLMADWIIDQKEKLNIRMVLCVGDLVEQNNLLQPDGINGDQPSISQWKAARTGFAKLDNRLPYILCTGNHDYGTKSAENRYSQFNSYFPPQGNPLNLDLLVEMAPNAQGVETLENGCFEWNSPDGQLFLIFSLEFAPRTEILTWAKELAARPEYEHHTAVVLTHSYMDSRGVRIEKENYKLAAPNYGKTIWEELVQPSSNIRLVFCGHIADEESHRGQVGYREDDNRAGVKVCQMMFNAQREGGGWHGNGGDGWLRILEFLPDRKIKVRTFSPLFWISPSTRYLAWRTASYDQFEFAY